MGNSEARPALVNLQVRNVTRAVLNNGLRSCSKTTLHFHPLRLGEKYEVDFKQVLVSAQ